MGTFSVEVGIGNRDRDEWVTLDALVDTGAFVTSAPASLLRGLGVEPMRTQEFELADGEMREMEVGQTWVRVGDREVITLVLFNDEGSMPLLGALTLEGVFMGVDPVHKRLVPIRAVMAEVEMAAEPRTFGANSEWPIGDIPPMPLRRGTLMARSAFRELRYVHRKMDIALYRQHILAVQEADNKWQAEQSRLKMEAAERFWIRAKGGAALLAAAGGGSVVTLIIQRLFPA